MKCDGCICDFERYGCVKEICPSCYCDKERGDRLCRPCTRFQTRRWRLLMRLFGQDVLYTNLKEK